VTEWLKVADCKSVGIIPRWFEPNSSHIKSFRVLKKNPKPNKLEYLHSYRRFKLIFSPDSQPSNLFIDNKINTSVIRSVILFYKKIRKYNVSSINILECNIYKFFNVNKVFRVPQHVVSLNFRRRNFFPSIQSKNF
jgi:hypothetical protein